MSVLDSEEEDEVVARSERDHVAEEEGEALIREPLIVISDKTEQKCNVTYAESMGI